MKLENIEEARILINKLNRLQDVIDKSERWKSGHFVFTEHFGDRPDRINIGNFDELQKRMFECIKDEIKIIEDRLKKL